MTVFRRLLRIAVLLAVLLVVAAPALAQSETPPPAPTDLSAVLSYLWTGGAALVAAAFLSWLSERIPQFGALGANTKWSLQIGLSTLLGVGAWYLITYQPALVEQLAPIFKVVVLAVAPVIANQAWHAAQKALTPAA